MQNLTKLQTGVLGLVARCGGARVDLSGRRINDKAKSAARECLRKGLLTGKESAWTITEAGRVALSDAERPAISCGRKGGNCQCTSIAECMEHKPA